MRRPTKRRIAMRRPILITALGLASAAALLAFAPAAGAHPLGNLTINTSAEIVLRSTSTTIDYVVDMAELPTVQARQAIRQEGEAAWRDATCATVAGNVTFSGIAARPAGATLDLLPGQGGLQTLRLGCTLTVPGVDAERSYAYVDTNWPDSLGWREVVLLADRVTVVSSDAPSTSPSDRLRNYPTGVAAPRVTALSVLAEPGGPALAPVASAAAFTNDEPLRRGNDRLTSYFNHLVGKRDLTLPLALACAGIAVLLGGLHALAPGHGKTLMAAAVVGRRGGNVVRQVGTIGLSVAISHTAGVLAIGTLIWVSQAIAPDRVLPWLTIASGILLVTTGAALLYRRVVLGRATHVHPHLPGRLAAAHAHHDHAVAHAGHDHADHEHGHGHAGHEHGHGHAGHEHGHGHDHAGHEHHHDHAHHDHAPHEPAGTPATAVRTRWLVLMGVAGGLVPTPSALVVLLGSAALGHAWFGVVLVAVYGIGMSLTLVTAGLALVRAQRWLERRWYGTAWMPLLMRALPAVTAAALVLGGAGVVVRGYASL